MSEKKGGFFGRLFGGKEEQAPEVEVEESQTAGEAEPSAAEETERGSAADKSDLEVAAEHLIEEAEPVIDVPPVDMPAEPLGFDAAPDIAAPLVRLQNVQSIG